MSVSSRLNPCTLTCYGACKSRRNVMRVFNHINCLDRFSTCIRLLCDWITHIELYCLHKQKWKWMETAVFQVSCTVNESEKISCTTFRWIYITSKNVPKFTGVMTFAKGRRTILTALPGSKIHGPRLTGDCTRLEGRPSLGMAWGKSDANL